MRWGDCFVCVVSDEEWHLKLCVYNKTIRSAEGRWCYEVSDCCRG